MVRELRTLTIAALCGAVVGGVIFAGVLAYVMTADKG